MRDLFFIARMGLITFAIIMLMQIQVGNKTIENHSLQWIRTSFVVDHLQDVADGAALAIKKGFSSVTQNMNAEFFKNFNKEDQAGYRHLRATWARSKSYVEEQAEKAKKKVKEKLDSEE